MPELRGTSHNSTTPLLATWQPGTLHLNQPAAKERSEEQTGHVYVFPIRPSSTSVPMISSPTLTSNITFHSRLITSLFPFNHQLYISLFFCIHWYMNVVSFKAFLVAFPHQSQGKHQQNSYQVIL